MAYTRTISITNMEIATKLAKEENVSLFIQGLLEKHYSNTDLKKLTLEQLNKLHELAKIQEDIDKQEAEILNNAI